MKLFSLGLLCAFLSTALYGQQKTFTQVSGSPFSNITTAARPGTYATAFSPLINGSLYVTSINRNADTAFVYHINDQGQFTHIQTLTNVNSPTSIAYSPTINGKLFAAIANSAAIKNYNNEIAVPDGTPNVALYAIDTDTGLFTLITKVPSSGRPYALAFSPLINNTTYLAVTDAFKSNVNLYTLNATAQTLTPVAGSPFAAPSAPLTLAFSLVINGKAFAAITGITSDAAGSQSASAVYSLGSGGTFTQVANSPFVFNGGTTSIAFSPIINEQLLALVSSIAPIPDGPSGVSSYLVDPTTGAFTFKQLLSTAFIGQVTFSPLVDGSTYSASTTTKSIIISKFDTQLTATPFQTITPSNPSSRYFYSSLSPVFNNKLYLATADKALGNLVVYSLDVSNPIPLPTGSVIATPASVCTGQTFTLTAKIANATSLMWSGPDNFSSTESVITITNASAANTGTYKLTATNSTGSATFEVTVRLVQTNPQSLISKAIQAKYCF